MDDLRLVKIGEAAKILGTIPATMRAWERSGELLPARRTRKGTRYYAISDLLDFRSDDAEAVGYARVSSPGQKADLDMQHAALEAYCAAKGWQCTVVRDLGSGLDHRKEGLQRVLEMILRRRTKRLVLTHKDRLFGSELVFDMCKLQGVEVVVINAGERPNFEEDLAKDVQEIITAFSARLHGARSRKSKKLLEALTDVKEAAKELS